MHPRQKASSLRLRTPQPIDRGYGRSMLRQPIDCSRAARYRRFRCDRFRYVVPDSDSLIANRHFSYGGVSDCSVTNSGETNLSANSIRSGGIRFSVITTIRLFPRRYSRAGADYSYELVYLGQPPRFLSSRARWIALVLLKAKASQPNRRASPAMAAKAASKSA